MANAKIEKLQAQLDTYKTELKYYEQDFLANDGKIDPEEQEMLDVILEMIEDVKVKLEVKTSGKKSKTTQEIQIPKSFEDGYVKIGLAIKDLEGQIQKLEKAQKLFTKKEKVLARIQKIRAAVPKIEVTFSKSSGDTQIECKRRMDLQLDFLKKLEDKVHQAEVPNFALPQEIEKEFTALDSKLNTLKNLLDDGEKNLKIDSELFKQVTIDAEAILFNNRAFAQHDDEEIRSACDKRVAAQEKQLNSFAPKFKALSKKVEEESSLDSQMAALLNTHGTPSQLYKHLEKELKLKSVEIQTLLSKFTK